MTPQEFAALAAQDYNRIPVSREVLADTETPLSAYIKLASGPNSYLFESVQGGEKWGRYSIIGLPCRTLLRVCGYRVEVVEQSQETRVDPELAFRWYRSDRQYPKLDRWLQVKTPRPP